MAVPSHWGHQPSGRYAYTAKGYVGRAKPSSGSGAGVFVLDESMGTRQAMVSSQGFSSPAQEAEMIHVKAERLIRGMGHEARRVDQSDVCCLAVAVASLCAMRWWRRL